MRAAEEAGAEARVGSTVDNGLEQLAPVGGIVLEIGVLHDDHVARTHRERLANGGTLATVHWLEMEPVDATLLEQLLEELARAVRGKIVDDDDLLGHGLGVDLVENKLDRVALV